MKKFITILILGLLVLAGCGSSNDDTNNNEANGDSKASDVTELTFWTPEVENKDIFDNMVDEFNSTHDDIQIKPEYFDDESYKTKMKVAISGNQMPDVFFYWSGDAFNTLVDADVVADMTSYLEQDSEFAERVLPGGLDAFTVDGKRYGVPSATSGVMLFYNKEIFEENDLTPPQTYEELLTAVEKLNEENITPITVSGKDRWPLLHWYSYLAQRIGGNEPFDKVKNGEADFTQESYITAGETLQELAIDKKAFVNGFLGLDYAAAESLFINERAAMYLQGDWAIGTFAKDSEFAEKVGFLPFPEFENGEGDKLIIHGGFGQGYSIAESTENKEAAFEAIKFLSGERKELIESGLPSGVSGEEIDESNMSPLALEYIQFITETPEGFFGYYDQQLDTNVADQLLNITSSIVGGADVTEELSKVEIE